MSSNRNRRTSISNGNRPTTKSEGHNVANPSKKDGPVRCAIDGRTATAPGTVSLDGQVADCRAAADKHGWVVVDECIATDEGLSGLHWAGRPGLEQLLVALESQRRPYNYLLVSDFLRLSRNRKNCQRI
jgi:Resolvase, N terminal domain